MAPFESRRQRIISAASLAVLRARRKPSVGAPPLFVIGSGRSGNTLVRRVLMASGAIYIPPETYVLGEIINTWMRTTLLPWRERVWLFCAYFEKHEEFATFGLESLNDFATQAADLPKGQQTLRDLLDAFYAYLATVNGSAATRWGDKTPYNTYYLTEIAALFPKAQFLWLVRDGRDVALSYAQSGFYSDVPAAAKRWYDANDACQTFAKSEFDVFQQGYENLVTDPTTAFERIFKWANLDFDSQFLTAPTGDLGDVEKRAHHANVQQPISATSIGRWRDKLSDADRAALPPAFWAMMDQLGYTAR